MTTSFIGLHVRLQADYYSRIQSAYASVHLVRLVGTVKEQAGSMLVVQWPSRVQTQELVPHVEIVEAKEGEVPARCSECDPSYACWPAHSPCVKSAGGLSGAEQDRVRALKLLKPYHEYGSAVFTVVEDAVNDVLGQLDEVQIENSKLKEKQTDDNRE